MMRSRAEEIDFDLYAQEELYKKETGDRHWYVGFGRRFGEWCEKNPRRQLKSTGATKSNAEN